MDVSRKGDDSLQEILAQLHKDEDARQRLLKRKKYELKIIRKFDTNKLNAYDCWFMIDAQWLNQWSIFVNDEENEDPPGVLSTKELLMDDPTAVNSMELTTTSSPMTSSSSTSAYTASMDISTSSASTTVPLTGGSSNVPVKRKVPLPNLQARIDYRAVSPLVYFIFVELYGRDSSPDICRYSLDIYKAEVPVERLVNIKLKAVMEAKIQVNKIRPKWMKWEQKFDDDEDEAQSSGCCGLTKEHLETFIYWAIRCWSCWSRKKSGRENIQYSKYKPLTDTDAMDESVRLQNGSTHSSAGSWLTSLGWSSHGKMDDSSTHSTKSSGSQHGGIQELTRTKNELHKQKYSRGPRSRQIIKEEEDEDYALPDGDSSDEEEQYTIGPADRGHESGQWLRALSSSQHGK